MNCRPGPLGRLVDEGNRSREESWTAVNSGRQAAIIGVDEEEMGGAKEEDPGVRQSLLSSIGRSAATNS